MAQRSIFRPKLNLMLNAKIQDQSSRLKLKTQAQDLDPTP